MIPSDTARAQWRQITKAHTRVEAAFRGLIAAETIPTDHEASRELLGSLIELRGMAVDVAIELFDVDLHNDREAVLDFLLPPIIDIEEAPSHASEGS